MTNSRPRSNARKLRLEASLSQLELAAGAGLSIGAIQRLEAGSHLPFTRVDTLNRVAKVLGCTVAELCPGLIR